MFRRPYKTPELTFRVDGRVLSHSIRTVRHKSFENWNSFESKDARLLLLLLLMWVITLFIRRSNLPADNVCVTATKARSLPIRRPLDPPLDWMMDNDLPLQLVIRHKRERERERRGNWIEFDVQHKRFVGLIERHVNQRKDVARDSSKNRRSPVDSPRESPNGQNFKRNWKEKGEAGRK